MNRVPDARSIDFLERISRALRKESLVSTGEIVLVACSGGVDSMVLLDVMDRLGRKEGFSIAAVHLDHSLRGLDSREDQRLVARFCGRQGIPFVGGQEDVRRFCDARGLSLQEGARRVRYAFLEESLRKIRGHKIATAHHADDQVETILMRLLRGTGPAGLRGIPVERDGVFIRPLLSVWKADIEDYAHVMRLPFREDPGNREPWCLRNKIRNVLIPSLEVYNPRVRESLARFSRLIVEEGEALDLFIDETLKRVEFKRKGEEITVNRDGLLECHPFVIKEIVRRAILELGGGYGPDHRHLMLSLRFIQHQGSGKRMELPGGMVLGRDFNEIFIRIDRKRNRREHSGESIMDVPIKGGWNGRFSLGERDWMVQVDIFAREDVDDSAGTTDRQYFDRKRIRPPLLLRAWRPGDTLRPVGMEGRKKVSDLLTEERVARRKRDHVFLLEDGESVLWVVGVRRSRRALVVGDSEEILSVSIREGPDLSGRKTQEPGGKGGPVPRNPSEFFESLCRESVKCMEKGHQSCRGE